MEDPSASIDFGSRGCTDGISQEFKQRMSELELGEVLEIVVRDPSARSDLPAMSRMLGHDLLATEESDGEITMRFRRGR